MSTSNNSPNDRRPRSHRSRSARRNRSANSPPSSRLSYSLARPSIHFWKMRWAHPRITFSLTRQTPFPQTSHAIILARPTAWSFIFLAGFPGSRMTARSLTKKRSNSCGNFMMSRTLRALQISSTKCARSACSSSVTLIPTGWRGSLFALLAVIASTAVTTRANS